MEDWKPDEKFFEFLRNGVDKDYILKRLVIVIANVDENSFNLDSVINEMATGSDWGRLCYSRLYANPVMGGKYNPGKKKSCES